MGPQIVVRVQPKPLTYPVRAIVDTAAPWCILEPHIGELIVDELELLRGPLALSTRLGVVRGTLYRGLITVLAEEGENLDLDGAIFLSPDWRGGNFIGYEGMLDRARFAVDPATNLFYFAEVGG